MLTHTRTHTHTLIRNHHKSVMSRIWNPFVLLWTINHTCSICVRALTADIYMHTRTFHGSFHLQYHVHLMTCTCSFPPVMTYFSSPHAFTTIRQHWTHLCRHGQTKAGEVGFIFYIIRTSVQMMSRHLRQQRVMMSDRVDRKALFILFNLITWKVTVSSMLIWLSNSNNRDSQIEK